MSDAARDRTLRAFLVFAGIVCLIVYSLIVVSPSGWDWGEPGRHYLHTILVVYATLGVFLILAARDPGRNRSLLLFAAWSSAAHGALMAVRALVLPGQHAHLTGDVPAMFVLALGLAVLMPRPAPAAG